MKAKTKNWGLGVWVVLAVLSIYGCGAVDVEQSVKQDTQTPIANSESPDVKGETFALAGLTEQCTVGKTAFQNSVHPLLRAHCTECHDQQKFAGPRFAVADVDQSYSSVVRLQDFDSITTSKFYRVGGNSHCANDYQTPCGIVFSDIQASVQSWWDNGEKDCPRKGKFFSAPTSIPASLPDRDHGFMRIRWDLGPVNALLRNSFFEMEAQLFSAGTEDAPTTYRFRKPRVVSPTRTIHLKDVKVLVNGSFNPLSDSFRSIEGNVVPQGAVTDPTLPSNAPVLSPEALFVFKDTTANADLVVSFEELNSAPAMTCKAQDVFTAQVLPAISLRNCQACHGGNGLSGRYPANVTFNMNVATPALCVGFLQRMNKRGVLSSAGVTYPLRSSNAHPRVLVDEAEANAIFGAWFTAENTAP